MRNGGFGVDFTFYCEVKGGYSLNLHPIIDRSTESRSLIDPRQEEGNFLSHTLSLSIK